MGLDLCLARIDYSQDFRARWSYSGFNAFRRKVAAEIGITLDEMYGFGGTEEWPSALDEPLVYLLNHSDCDGELGYGECIALAPRLRPIVEAWPDDVGHAYDREMGIRLCDLLDEVANGDAAQVVFT